MLKYFVMRVATFSFELPNNLVARYRQAERGACRLLYLDGETEALVYQTFTNLPDKLENG